MNEEKEKLLVSIFQDEVIVSSEEMADFFGLEHDKLVHLIKAQYRALIDTSENISKGPCYAFIEKEYTKDGQPYTEFWMRRDGALLLLMNISSPKADVIKLCLTQWLSALEDECNTFLAERTGKVKHKDTVAAFRNIHKRLDGIREVLTETEREFA